MTSTDLSVAILAGGMATRLRPITEKIPKLLVEVAGEPFFSHQIRLLKSAGLRHLVLCVGYLGEKIVDLYGDGSKWGVKIEYAFDGPMLLGTGGALIGALPKLGDAFFMLYGDSYLPVDYRAVGDFFQRSGRLGLMTVYENHGRYDTSNVWFEHGELKIYDKKNKVPQMHHIDYGLGVFRAAAFDGFPRDAVVDLATVQTQLCERRQLAGYEIKERFYEIGSHEGLAELSQRLGRVPVGQPSGRSPTA
ncbi:MAG: nucleotidyl transferase [Opitutus sp.]|nr:nucleotidyl transferase [Opitutus sp.]